MMLFYSFYWDQSQTQVKSKQNAPLKRKNRELANIFLQFITVVQEPEEVQTFTSP